MSADELPTPPGTEPAAGGGEGGRLDRIAERLIASLTADPEFQSGDAVFVLLDHQEAATSRRFGYESPIDALHALAEHTQAVADASGFRMMFRPVAGG